MTIFKALLLCVHLAVLCGTVRGIERSDLIAPACSENCNVRLADGDCYVNVTCLFDAGKEASGPASSFFLNDEASERSFCRGHCVFQDTDGFCRLDLICLLQRDAAATREFLEQFGVYDEEVVEALALTAGVGSGGKGVPETQQKYDKQVLPPLSPEKEDKEGDEEDNAGDAAMSAIVGAPLLPCPGRCEVRNPSRECVVDPECAIEL